MVAMAHAQFHHPSQFRQSGFVPLQQEHRESETIRPDDATPAAAVNYRQQSFEYEEEDDAPQSTQPPPQRRQQFLRPNAYATQQPQQKPNTKNRFEDELEIEEPDRLALFLEKSTFQCEGRTG